MAEKVDLKRLDAYRAKAGEFRILEVPPMQYLMIDGHGDPNTSPDFAAATAALYPVAYKLKFASKQRGRDYTVMPLEGLWSADDMDAFTTARDKTQWDWTLLNLVPDWLTADDVAAAVDAVGRRDAPARLADVRLGPLAEGLCVQTLHIGSYDAEAPVLARMHHEFIPGEGLEMTGLHHEIYLSDWRKVAPQKLRTILRQPVRRR